MSTRQWRTHNVLGWIMMGLWRCLRGDATTWSIWLPVFLSSEACWKLLYLSSWLVFYHWSSKWLIICLANKRSSKRMHFQSVPDEGQINSILFPSLSAFPCQTFICRCTILLYVCIFILSGILYPLLILKSTIQLRIPDYVLVYLCNCLSVFFITIFFCRMPPEILMQNQADQVNDM